MFGYFASKLAAERVVAESGLPWTTLRATQVHELMLTTVQKMSRLPVVPVPSGVRFQPVAADEVAARLVELALGTPAGLVPDLAGPKTFPMEELLRSYLRARRKHRCSCRYGFREGCPRVPGRREPCARPGRWPADLGGVPGRAGRLTSRSRDAVRPLGSRWIGA